MSLVGKAYGWQSVGVAMRWVQKGGVSRNYTIKKYYKQKIHITDNFKCRKSNVYKTKHNKKIKK